LVFGDDEGVKKGQHQQQHQQQQQGPVVVDPNDGESVDFVRGKCEDLSVVKDGQKHIFTVIVQCSNKVTRWSAGMGYYSVPHMKHLTAKTEMKDQRFLTDEFSQFDHMAASNGTCPMYYQFERTMETTVDRSIEQCSQINHEYLSQLCRVASKEFCDDNTSNGPSHSQHQQQQQQQQQQSNSGMCVWNQIAVIDGCAGYSR